MNSVIETVIAKVLSPYLEGISRENLRLGLFAGDLKLRDLRVNPEILTELNLPRCSLHSATVDLVSVAIPWKNPVSGRIVIQVSGIKARVRYNLAEASLDRTNLIAIRRAVIDGIKAKLEEAAEGAGISGIESAESGSINPLAALRGDTFAVKMIRKLVQSIIVEVSDVDLSVVLPSATALAFNLDEEGFADAVDESSANSVENVGDDCELRVVVGSVRLSNGDEEGQKKTNLLKKLQIENFSLSLYPVGHLAAASTPGESQILPPCSLLVEMEHDGEASELAVKVSGMEACEVKFRRSQLVLLKDAGLAAAQMSDLSQFVKSVDMNDEAVSNYTALYRSATGEEFEGIAELANVRSEMNDLCLLFDPRAVARCEYLVDRERLAKGEAARLAETGYTGEKETRGWFGGLKRIFSGSKSSETGSEIDRFDEQIRKELEESSSVEVPVTIRLVVNACNNWSVSLLHDGEADQQVFLRTHLLGAEIAGTVCSPSDTSSGKLDMSLSVVSRGFRVVCADDSVLAEFISKVSTTVASATVAFSRESATIAPTIDLAVSALPLRFTYPVGFARDASAYFGFLADAEIVDTISAQRERILKSGLDVLESVKNSREYKDIAKELSSTQLSLKLEISGPLIVLPAGRSGGNLHVSLGHLSLTQARSVIDGSADTAPLIARLEDVSITCELPHGERMQILSPAPLELSAAFLLAERTVDVLVNVNEPVVCRLSPEIFRTLKELGEFFGKEMGKRSEVVGEKRRRMKRNDKSQESDEEEESGSRVQVGRGSVGSEGSQGEEGAKLVGVKVSASIRRVELMMSDRATDCLQIQVGLPEIFVAVNIVTQELSCSVDEIRVVARCMREKVGEWEPLLEPTTYALTVNVGEGGADVAVLLKSSLSSNTELNPGSGGTNLVLSPASIQRLIRLGNHIGEALQDLPSPTTGMKPPTLPTRYRVVNATTFPVYLHLGETSVTVPPNDEYFSIDEFVLPNGLREVSLSFRSDFSASKATVPLDRFHSALLRHSGREVLSPALVHSLVGPDNAFRCVLISQSGFIFNQCDVPMELSLPPTYPTPPAELVGAAVMHPQLSRHILLLDKDEWACASHDTLLLNPGRFVSVPFDVLPSTRVRPVTGGTRPWSADPLVTFSGVSEFSSSPSNFDTECGSGFHLRVELRKRESELPLLSPIYQVHLRPPLVVTNTTAASLKVKHAPAADSEKRVVFTVSPWESVAVYSVQAISAGEHDMSKLKLSVGFLPLESEWTGHVGVLEVPETDEATLPVVPKVIEERFELSADPATVAPVHFTTTCKHAREVVVSTKWWIVDRTGLGLVLEDADSGLLLPRGDRRVGDLSANVWFLRDPDVPSTVTVKLGRDRLELTLPDSGYSPGWLGRVPLVVISKETFRDKFLEIVPKYTLFNGLTQRSVFVDRLAALLPCGSSSGSALEEPLVEVRPNSGIPVILDTIRFKLDPAGDHAFSAAVPLEETSAGVWPLLVGDTVCRVEIAPVSGTVNVSIREQSSVIVRNKKRSKSVHIKADKHVEYVVPPMTDLAIGWVNPFRNAESETWMRIGTGTEFKIPLARAGDGVTYGGCVTVEPGEDPQSVLIVVERSASYQQIVTGMSGMYRKWWSMHSGAAVDILERNKGKGKGKNMRVEVQIDQIGLSLVNKGQELIYAQLALIKTLVRADAHMLRLALLVSEMQVDTSVVKPGNSPVIVTNLGLSDQPFLEAVVETNLNVSRGIAAVSCVSVQFDALFVEVDSAFMEAMEECFNDLMGGFEEDEPTATIAMALHSKHMLESLGPITQYTVKSFEVPMILILDALEVSPIRVQLWVDFSLRSLAFMPVSLKLVVGMLSLGGSFKLAGANVSLNRRSISEFRGSSTQFLQSISHDYTIEALKNAATLLGSSSLLAIPRAPIQLVTGVGAFGLERATQAVGGLGGLIADLASDSKYREAQERIRKAKRIGGFTEGLAEGANRLTEGAGGVLDIFKKPISGAKKSGVAGFFRGLGTGLVGTIVKPVTKVGEAVADIGTGIARTFGPGNAERGVYLRKRVPRAFYGRLEFVADYVRLDAFLAAALPKPQILGMELVLSLVDSTALVAFADKLLVVRVVESSAAAPTTAASETDREEIIAAQDSSFAEAVVLREIFVTQIRAVQVGPAAKPRCVVVEDIFGLENIWELDLPVTEFGALLLDSLRGVLTPTALRSGQLDWRPTRAALAEIRFANHTSLDYRSELQDQGKRIEVFEVERFLMTYGWTTPFLLLDSDTGWRWVDGNLKRYPKIKQGLSRKDAAGATHPPVTFGELWTPIDQWTVEKDPDTTDSEGWMYAISFTSSTWQRFPGITASVRKRKWVRHFA